MEFTALQIHYTSCRRGQSAGAGFQVRASTPGIAPNDLKVCERRGGYRAPHDRPSNPTPDELSALFPHALRWYLLPSGQRALTMSSYVGMDFSGRWGNFFAHTLVLGAHPPGIWPIDYLEWSEWRHALPPEEDTEVSPAALPLVDLGEIVPAASFTLDQLSAFLTEEPGRERMVAAMIRALLRLREDKRPVVIRDSELRGLFWVACLQKAVGWQHARTLSWSTYQSDPRAVSDVSATTGETDFRFDETERSFQFRVFDLASGVHSPLLEGSDDYGAIVAGWMVHAPDTLGRWHDFLEHFEDSEPTEALLAALRLFRALEEPEHPLTPGELQAATEFADQRGRPEARATLLPLVTRAFGAVGPLSTPSQYRALISYLARGARAVGGAEARRLATSVWGRMFDQFVLERGEHLDETMEAVALLRESLDSVELAEAFRDTHPVETLAAAVLHGSGAVADAVLSCAWQSARAPAWEDPWFSGVAQVVRQRNEPGELRAGRLLRLAAWSPAAVVGLCALLGEGDDLRATGRALARLHSDLPEPVRRALGAASRWEVLYGAWTSMLERTSDKRRAFEAHYATCLAQWPEYGRLYSGLVAGDLLQSLPPGERGRQGLAWIRSGLITRLPPNVAGACLLAANLLFRVGETPIFPQEDAALVDEWAGRLGVALRPNHPRLRLALEALRVPERFDARIDAPSFPPRELATALEAIPVGDYGTFLRAYLGAALDRADSAPTHCRLLELVLVDAQLQTFRTHYLEALRARARGPWGLQDEAALMTWVVIDRRLATARRLETLRRDALEALVAGVDGFDDRELLEMEDRLSRDSRLRLDPAEVATLAAFFDRAVRRRDGLLRKLWRKVPGRRSGGEEDHGR